MKIKVVFLDLYHDTRISIIEESRWVPISNIGFLYGPLIDYKNMRL